MLEKTLSIARTPSALVAVAIFLLAGMVVWPQAQPPAMYDPKLISYNATPFGTCQVDQVALNTTNGAFYSCNPFTHTWVGTQAAALPMSITQGGFTHSLTAATTAARTWTLQDTSDTFVFRATTDTLTNKTLTSPTITNPSTTGTDSGTETLANKTLTSPSPTGTDSGTETLQNKTLTGASSSNSVTSLNAQANSSAVTGTGSAVTLYTYSLPGSTVANLKGFRVNVGWIHNSGSALVTYNLQLNGVNVAHIVNSGLGGNGAWVNATVLNTGSTTGTVVWSLLDFSLNQVSSGQATALTGLAWSSSQILQFTFSVANADQVTPVFWNVELIQ